LILLLKIKIIPACEDRDSGTVKGEVVLS